MGKIYRTSRGTNVDMDMLRLANESTIAVGNMRVNARGDELGHGGKVVRTRAEIMKEYHKLNTPVADDSAFSEEYTPSGEYTPQPEFKSSLPVAVDTPVVESSDSAPAYVKPRGSFAESVAKETEVNQELLEPAASRNAPTGINRI